METLPFLIDYANKHENFKNEKIIDLMTVLYDYLINLQASTLQFNTFSNAPYKANHKTYSDCYYNYLFFLENISHLNARELHKFISHLNFVDDKYILDGWNFDHIKHHLKHCINFNFNGTQTNLF